MATQWETFTRRTDDPKLAYLERRLTDLGIPHRRNGWSFHAPILEVPAEYLDAAWALLRGQVDMGDGRTMELDEIPDDDVLFAEADVGGCPYEPHDHVPDLEG